MEGMGSSECARVRASLVAPLRDPNHPRLSIPHFFTETREQTRSEISRPPSTSPWSEMQAAQGYHDLLLATNEQLDKWRHQQQQQASQSAQAPASASKTARIEICGKCEGHRIVKVVHQQHMVLERTCSQCNGEGVITTQEPQAITASSEAARSQTQSCTPASTQAPSVQSA